MKKKILISTGGSGGHVIPAAILYDQLKNEFDTFLTIDNRGKNFLNLKNYNYTIINTPKLFSSIVFFPINLPKLRRPFLTFFAFFFQLFCRYDILQLR